MPRISRKYRIDAVTGVRIECTEPEVAALCDEIAAGTNVFKRNIFDDDSVPGQSTRTIARWPIVSTAAGVDAEDVPAAKAFLAEHGVRTEFTPQGDPIFRDKSHRKAHCQAFGYYDRDGCYGDP